MQAVGHGEIKRRAQSGAEIVEEHERGDEPQLAPVERRLEAGERVFHALKIDRDFFLGNQKQRSDDDGQRRHRNDRGGAVQCGGRRQMLDQLAAEDGGRHRGNVEPQPLLIDEGAALVQPLAVLDQHGAAQRARYRHRISGDHERDEEVARRGELRHPEESADGGDVDEQQVAFAPIAEQRHEIGDQAVKRLDDPGQVEQRDEAGDLQRRPALRGFEIIVQRLRDQAADLAKTLDDIDQGEEQQQMVESLPVVRQTRGLRRCGLAIHRIDANSRRADSRPFEMTPACLTRWVSRAEPGTTSRPRSAAMGSPAADRTPHRSTPPRRRPSG